MMMCKKKIKKKNDDVHTSNARHAVFLKRGKMWTWIGMEEKKDLGQSAVLLPRRNMADTHPVNAIKG